MGANARIVVAACVALLGGCTAEPDGLYCEGGVRDGKPQGGECLDIKKESSGDRAVVGTAIWVSDYTHPYTLKRAGKSRYELVLQDKPIGTLEQDGHWLRIVFLDGRRASSVRNDLPGFLH